ncbi:MAG: phosphoribosylglycinamide formyltransferase [Thermotogae bacterium]|nr:phosphoribosylglycinamide formyltransferase [Thermotogota bacterium]
MRFEGGKRVGFGHTKRIRLAFLYHRGNHLKIAVLISGRGSNLQSILNAIRKNTLNCVVSFVISDREDAAGLIRAQKRGIPTYVVDRKIWKERLSDEILRIVSDQVDLIVLAGFLSLLKGEILNKYKNRIINIHPSLIPAFCGKGMYGMKVHESAITYRVGYSGCTVHFVDEGMDTGGIILQKIVKVNPEDTPDTLAKKILKKEHQAIVEAINLFLQEENH